LVINIDAMFARSNVDFSEHVTTFDHAYVNVQKTLLKVLTTFLPFLTQPLFKYICKNVYHAVYNGNH